MKPHDEPETCAHCGEEALGYARVGEARVCHHELRDCYEAVTVWGQTLGNGVSLIKQRPVVVWTTR